MRYESNDPRHGWVTAEQIIPGDLIISAFSHDQMEITDVVPVDDPRGPGLIPALRGWVNGDDPILDGRQLPDRYCGYRVGDMRDCIAYPTETTWQTMRSAARH